MARRIAVSVIGSFRKHYDEAKKAAFVFDRANLAVLSPPVSSIVNHGADFVRFETDLPAMSDRDIQDATFEKLFRSDAIYVVAPDGYIGNTTNYELGRLHGRGIPIYFSDVPRDFPVHVDDSQVVTPDELTELILSGQVVAHRPRKKALVSADVVVLTIREHRLHVLLVRRGKEPFKGRLALPGGFLRADDETLEMTALRELAEETALAGFHPKLMDLGVYSRPFRDPRGRVITKAYAAIAPDLPEPVASTDAQSADWVEVEDSLAARLAFDHGSILNEALERTRRSLYRSPIALEFCAPEFTLSQLQSVFEIVGRAKLETSNFRRRMLNPDSSFITAVGKTALIPSGRPPALYTRRADLPAKKRTTPSLAAA